MRRLVIGFAAVAVAGGLIWAGEECDKTKCNVGEKVTKLLSSWQTAVEAEKSGCAEERAKLNTEIDALAKQCPVGSRVGETIAFVRTALETAVKADEECAKACAAKTVETAVKSDLCEKKIAEVVASVRADQCEVSAAKTVLASIEGLGCEKKAGEIAAAIRGEACAVKAGEILAKAASEVCASKKPAAVETAVKTEACAKTCATSEACCKELAARSQVLKASWEKAGSELTSLCPTKRKEMAASFAGLQGRSKRLALMPETISALALGIEKIHGINTKMVEWAKANPDALKGMSAEAHTAFTSQLAAIGEAHEVLAKMSAATGCAAACAEKKTETTTSVN